MAHVEAYMAFLDWLAVQFCEQAVRHKGNDDLQLQKAPPTKGYVHS